MNKINWFLIAIVAVLIVAGGFLLKDKISFNNTTTVTNTDGTTAVVDPSPSGYQSVFLINNQVYFGKLTNETGQFPVLKDVYYLQVNQQIQPADEDAAPTNTNNVSLVKLGGELHGPTDSMRINRDQILLIEDLRADSNVVKAIEEYKKNQAEQ